MTESNVMYGITLEDYSTPRHEAKTSLYCGNREELELFLNNLNSKEWAKERYAQMLQAFFDPTTNSYSLFGKEYPTTYSFQLLYTQENFLKNHMWEYNADDGSIYRLYAKQLIISRILARDPGHIYRFIRARITGLEVNIQGQGWVEIKDQFVGFPGVYSYENNQHIMNLYICNEVSEEYDGRSAYKRVKELDDDELQFITKDLVGEGLI